jgi:hypothetical protein
MMAWDYLAVLGSSCLAERSFSLSGHTDDARHRQMDPERFGAIQRLRGAYRDGWLQAHTEAWLEIDPDFEEDF